LASPSLWLPNDEQARSPLGLEPKSFARLAALPPEPDRLWHGFLAPGSLTMLAGHPFAGKSMLVSGLLRALADGESFLGRKTKATSALLLTEEDQASLRERAGRFGLFGIRSEYLDRSGSVGHEWSALVTRATEQALARKHRLLIIDTFPGLAGLGDEQENDAGAITSRLQPLQVAAGKGLAVLFLHHMNNANQPRGSKAFRGVVDISTRFLRRARSRSFRLETETRSTTSMAGSLRAELIQAPDGWFYRPLERGSDAPKTSSRPSDELLWDAVLQAGEKGVTYAALDRIDGLSRDIAKKRLPRWRAEKRVGRDGTGDKNDPYRWYPCLAG
jgi:AAA domain